MKTGINKTPSTTQAVAHTTATGALEQPPNVKQLQAYQQMADNSRRVQAQAQLQTAANRSAASAGIVQRTAVYVTFDPKRPRRVVPGSAEEDDIMFFNALRDKAKYTPERIQEIIVQMAAPAASEWDHRMAAFLAQPAAVEEADDDDGKAAVSDEEDAAAERTAKRGKKRSRSKSKKKKSPPKKTTIKAKEKAGSSDEDEDAERPVKASKKAAAKDGSSDEDDDAIRPVKAGRKSAAATAVDSGDEKKKKAAGPDVEWSNKTANGKLSYDRPGKKWWVKAGGGYEYGIMNVAAIKEKLVPGQKATYVKPVQDYGPASKVFKEQFDAFGVVVTMINGSAVSRTIPKSITEDIIALQDYAREAVAKHTADKATGIKTYRPAQLDDEKYAVAWGQPALSIKGTARNRTMIKTMDINYQPAGDGAELLPLRGEHVHSNKLYEREGLHGNGINARFSLVYLEKGALKLAPGGKLFFGSGKTTGAAAEKHSNADEIATMLVNSGQIGDVSEYDDGKHSHSEQAMIVYLSKHLDVFDAQLATLAAKNVRIVALVLDMYSNPNTVCEQCHASLNTFFTTSDWKARVTARLTAAVAGTNVAVAAPDVIIRVSSNKSYSASATAAIATAKATHTVTEGEHDINFIERTPFNKAHY
ncbi:MAG TPA: hypothetical protein VIM87_02070 [Chitinophaga sp.]|uniref:hypothetical protein n=1 Tax=Chitinophaga sp. TaxID=1869181 RepID=UPI002F955FDD